MAERPTTYHARRCAATLGIHWLEPSTEPDDSLLVFFAGMDESCSHNLHMAKVSRALPRTVCVGIEYPGHGRSSGARGELPSGDLAALLDDLAACVTFLAGSLQREPTRVLLAGHSLGGLIALLLPATHPQLGARLTGVIALAPAVDVLPSGCCAGCHCAGDTNRHSCSLLRPACLPLRAVLRVLLCTPAAAVLLPTEDPSHASPRLPRAELESTLASLAVAQMRPSGLLAILGLAAQLHGSAAWAAARAQPPLLLLTGGRDRAIPAASLRALAESRALKTWPPDDAGFRPESGSSYALCAQAAGHALLAGGVRWAGYGGVAGRDVASELLLPAIALWVEVQRPPQKPVS